MKKIFILLSIIVLTTGCSMYNVVRIDNKNIDDIVDLVLKGKKKHENVSLDGYAYYLPKGFSLYEKTETNSILYYNKSRVYLYVDVVSYYHRVTNVDFEVSNDSYYSKKLDTNGLDGYLEITKLDSKYFVEYMYNYSKIEAVVNEADLKSAIADFSTILRSVTYKDTILATLIGENVLDYNEEVFNIFRPKREDGNFLLYDESYEEDNNTNNVVEEDQLPIDEEIE